MGLIGQPTGTSARRWTDWRLPIMLRCDSSTSWAQSLFPHISSIIPQSKCTKGTYILLHDIALMPNSLHMNLWSKVCGAAKFRKGPHTETEQLKTRLACWVFLWERISCWIYDSHYIICVFLLVFWRSLDHVFQLLMQLFFFFFNLMFWDRVSCRIGWSRSQYIAEEGLKVLTPATSSFPGMMLAWWTGARAPGEQIFAECVDELLWPVFIKASPHSTTERSRCWPTLVILALRRQKQEDSHQYKATPLYHVLSSPGLHSKDVFQENRTRATVKGRRDGRKPSRPEAAFEVVRSGF